MALTAGCRGPEQNTDVGTVSATPPTTSLSPAPHPGFLYGRVITDDGTIYEGRLRWGRDEEASWGDYFNGLKDDNPWADHVSQEQLEKQGFPLTIFGFEFADWGSPIDLVRPFMARFGDIARIEAQGVFGSRVTLKSGTMFAINGMEANDFEDGVRVGDIGRGAVDLARRQIRSIEFLPTTLLSGAPTRLYGTVRTRQGDFTGFLQWDRQQGVGSDTLDGRTADEELSLRFDTLRSIARHSPDSALLTLLDGREIVLSGSREVGDGNRGIYVDDGRYGRVLISWNAFEHVDFSPGGSGPAYGDFPPGRPLTGSVTTLDGRRLVGRLVYDLDESETTDTLDAPSQGVDYTLPFGLVASIALPAHDETGARRAWVTLHSGEALELELAGDFGEGNAGLLVFVDGRQSPEYVLWKDVKGVAFDVTTVQIER